MLEFKEIVEFIEHNGDIIKLLLICLSALALEFTTKSNLNKYRILAFGLSTLVLGTLGSGFINLVLFLLADAPITSTIILCCIFAFCFLTIGLVSDKRWKMYNQVKHRVLGIIGRSAGIGIVNAYLLLKMGEPACIIITALAMACLIIIYNLALFFDIKNFDNFAVRAMKFIFDMCAGPFFATIDFCQDVIIKTIALKNSEKSTQKDSVVI